MYQEIKILQEIIFPDEKNLKTKYSTIAWNSWFYETYKLLLITADLVCWVFCLM